MNNKGETLVESLISLAILTVIMVGFPALIVSVSKLNDAVKNAEVNYKANKDNPVGVTVTINDGTYSYEYDKYVEGVSEGVRAYKDGDYYFYEY